MVTKKNNSIKKKTKTRKYKLHTVKHKNGISWRLVTRNHKRFVYVYEEDNDNNKKLRKVIKYKYHVNKEGKRESNLRYFHLRKEKQYIALERKSKTKDKKQFKNFVKQQKLTVPKTQKKYSYYETTIRFNICAFDRDNISNQFIDNKFLQVKRFVELPQMLKKILSEHEYHLIHQHINDGDIVTGGYTYKVVGVNATTNKFETIKSKKFGF